MASRAPSFEPVRPALAAAARAVGTKKLTKTTT